MTRNRASHAVLSLLRAALPSVLAFVGLTAVIVGILAMHVWMGGHGSSHHIAVPANTTMGTTISAHADTEAHTTGGPGHAHDHPTPAVVAVGAAVGPMAMDAASSPAADGGLVGCGGDCADEMMLGMCVLAMIVAGIAGLLTPAGRALLSTLVRRGPPALSCVSRPAPAPSLTQLCISRT
ncbi:hypothetical protein [Arthrobacter sp. MDT1-65]